jgi:hypothetical protein
VSSRVPSGSRSWRSPPSTLLWVPPMEVERFKHRQLAPTVGPSSRSSANSKDHFSKLICLAAKDVSHLKFVAPPIRSICNSASFVSELVSKRNRSLDQHTRSTNWIRIGQHASPRLRPSSCRSTRSPHPQHDGQGSKER